MMLAASAVASPISDSEMDWLAGPAGFAQGVLGLDLYPKQIAVLDALRPAGARVSFKSCNEGGKTKRVIAGAILWHLAMFPKGHVISTSGSFRQIQDQLVPALHGWRARFPKWDFMRSPYIQGERIECYWHGFSTNEAGRFEGHHEDVDAPLLIIVDEAKTVKDAIFEAIERCKPTRLLICSSPGYAEGEFYRSHTTRARFYQTFSQKAQECAHIRAEDIARVREKWGPNHPLVRSMIDAEFMPLTEDAIIDLRALEDLLANPPALNGRERKAFVDFAWSGEGDETVLALRVGNKVTIEEAFHEDNLHGLCGRLVGAFHRLGLAPHEIEGDEGGGGKLVCDQLAAMGWVIVRSNNQSAARWDDHYANLAAETWHEGGLKIARREVIIPDDNDLRGQLLDRKKKPHPKGLLAIESKQDMKKRGVPSPDRADAVLGAMTPLVASGSVNVSRAGWAEDVEQAGAVERIQRAGGWVG